MENKITALFFNIVKSVMQGTQLSESVKAELNDDTVNKLYALANKHDLAHIVAFALCNNNISIDKTLLKNSRVLLHRAVYRCEQKLYAYNELSQTFQENEITFIPLKGLIVANYYPESWMRTSCDIDVLVEHKNIEKSISVLKDIGWTLKDKTVYNDYSLFSPNGVHLELHFNIRENTDSLDNVLDLVWENTQTSAKSEYKLLLTNEFLMFHLLAHIAYHFLGGGCGIRPLIDIWLLRNQLSYNEETLIGFLKAANIDEFYANVIKLIDVWFEGATHTDVTKSMENYIFSGGIYGELSQRVAIQQIKNGGGVKNIVWRIFMPYEKMIYRYPVLKAKKYLLPLYQIKRWSEILINGRFNSKVKEFKINSNMSEEKVEMISTLLTQIGLDKL